MRETVGSLRVYFIVIGIFSLIFSMASLGSTPMVKLTGLMDTLQYALLWGNLILAVAYMGIGLKLKELLTSYPQVPLCFSLVAIVLSILALNLLGFIFNVYILYQLKRMAREAEPELEGQVLR